MRSFIQFMIGCCANLSFIASIVFVVFLMTACNRNYYYVPSPSNTLGLSEKGDFKFSGGIREMKEFENQQKSYNLQMGFSPLKNIGVYGNYFEIASKPKVFLDTGVLDNYGAQWDIGIGAYRNIAFPNFSKKIRNPKLFKPNNTFLLETYFSYGRGSIKNSYIEGGSSVVNFQRFGWQAGLQLKLKLGSLGISGLLGQIDYSNVSIDISNIDTNVSLGFWDDIALLNDWDPLFFTGYNIYYDIGIKQVRFYVSLTYHHFPGIKELQATDYLVNRYINTGIVIELDEIYKETWRKNKR